METSRAGCFMRPTISRQRVRSRGGASSASRRSAISSTPCSANTSGTFVHAFDIARGDDGQRIDVAEERDLLLHVGRQRALAAAQQDVGLNTDGAQFLDAVLGGLGLQFLRGGDPGDQGHVHEERIVAAELMAQLADGFEERQRFDVADGAADFDDHDVDRSPVGRGGHAARGGFNFVGHVRDHLHGLAQVIATALARDDLFVDASAGEVVGLGERRMGEALVVAEVEIGLGAVVGDEDLAVLEGAHGAGVDVEVGVELLQRDFEAAAFEQAADARGRDSLSPGRKPRRQ